MKLTDRLTDCQIIVDKLPEYLIPARYQLTCDVLINGHTKIKKEDVLASDGTGSLKFGDRVVVCRDTIEDKDRNANFEIIVNALFQIDHLLNGSETGSDGMPSPLVPSQFFDNKCKLNNLEIQIETILKKGHLHEINRHPRTNMRYDEVVLPLSRTKRLAPSAHRHLAAHSECWQKRTLTGIQPKKIKGLVSEEEYNLYENRVYARLMERLKEYLSERLGVLKELEDILKNKHELEATENLNYRLRRKLFSIWGETFGSKDTKGTLDILRGVQKSLETQLKTIRVLIQGSLYKYIPKNAQIPAQIQITNILAHDQHYRYLAHLWNNLRETKVNSNLLPEKKIQENIQLQKAYTNYCGLVIRRAFKELNYSIQLDKGSTYHLSLNGHDILVSLELSKWKIEDKRSNKKLIFVPIASWYSDELTTIKKKNSIIIPCCLHNENMPSHPLDFLTSKFSGPLVLSPLDFYVEERLVSLLLNWLWQKPLQSYGNVISKLPESVMPFFNNMPKCRVEKNYSIFLSTPLSKQDKQNILDNLEKAGAKTSISQFEEANLLLDQISRCPFCQNEAKFEPRDHRSFEAKCVNKDCKFVWGIYHDGEKSKVRFYTEDRVADDFSINGRWYGQISLSL